MSTMNRLARLNTEYAGPQSASTAAILGKLEALDNVLRLSLDKPEPAAAVATPPMAVEPPRPQPDFATAFDLLNRASAAMDVLQNRCDELENSAKVRADHFKMALDVAHQQMQACEQRAAAFEERAAAFEERAAAFEAKYNETAALVGAANQRAEAADRRARAAEQSASDSSEWLKCYYERIISAFGMRREPESLRPVA